MAIPLIAAAALPTAIKGISGLFGILKGNRRAKRNQFPLTQVDENIQKNAAIAEEMARTGLPAEQYNIAKQNIDRNRAIATNSIGRSSNPTAGINSILRGSNDAMLNLDAQNAGARLSNKKFAFGAREALAREKQRVFNWNKAKRYQDEADAASQQINAGKQNAFGSLTDASMLAQAYFGNDGDGGGTSSPNGFSNSGFFNRMNRYGTPNYNTTNGMIS